MRQGGQIQERKQMPTKEPTAKQVKGENTKDIMENFLELKKNLILQTIKGN